MISYIISFIFTCITYIILLVLSFIFSGAYVLKINKLEKDVKAEKCGKVLRDVKMNYIPKYIIIVLFLFSLFLSYKKEFFLLLLSFLTIFILFISQFVEVPESKNDISNVKIPNVEINKILIKKRWKKIIYKGESNYNKKNVSRK